MKKKMSLFLAAILSVSVLSVPTIADNTQDIKIVVSGNEIKSDQAPVIIDGRTLLPLRAVAEAVGTEVKWDNDTKTVNIETANIGLQLTIGDTQMAVNEKSEDGEITLMPMEVPAQIINGRTMVPLRTVAEALGLNVDWSSETKTVSISPNNSNEVYTVVDDINDVKEDIVFDGEKVSDLSELVSDKSETTTTVSEENSEATTSEATTRTQVLLSSDRKNLTAKVSSETISDSVVKDGTTLFSITASYGTIDGNDEYNQTAKEWAENVVKKEMQAFGNKTTTAYDKLAADEKNKFVPYKVAYESKVDFANDGVVSTTFTTKYYERHLIYNTVDDYAVTDKTGKINLTIEDLTNNKISTEVAFNAALDKFQQLIDADKVRHYLDKYKGTNDLKQSMITFHLDTNGSYVFTIKRGIISSSDHGVESVVIPSVDLLKLK